MWSIGDTVNTVLAATGLAVAIVGLAIVYWQVRKARGAAEAASQAATETQEAMTQRITAADLGSVGTALEALQNQLHAGQRETALRACQSLRRQLIALRARNASRLPKHRREELTWAVSTLSAIRESLERPPEDPEGTLDIAATNSDIDRIIDLVVEWQESPLSLETEAKSHEQRAN